MLLPLVLLVERLKRIRLVAWLHWHQLGWCLGHRALLVSFECLGVSVGYE